MREHQARALVSRVPDGQVWTYSSSPAECRGHSLKVALKRRSLSEPHDTAAAVSYASCIQYHRLGRIEARGTGSSGVYNPVTSKGASSTPHEYLITTCHRHL